MDEWKNGRSEGRKYGRSELRKTGSSEVRKFRISEDGKFAIVNIFHHSIIPISLYMRISKK
jgi:hypothetical protein